MNKVLLAAAVLSLLSGLWSAWSFFQGATTRDEFLFIFGLCSVTWFVLATAWNIRRG